MLSDILTCLSGSDRRDCICQVEAGCDGKSNDHINIGFILEALALIFEVCGKGKSCQARAILKLELFEEYVFENSSDDPIRFSLNLPILLDCLQLFGPTADAITATLTYSVGIYFEQILCYIVYRTKMDTSRFRWKSQGC